MSGTNAPQPVVVGVDSGAGSRAALRFAFEEGLERDAPVRVVTTWMLGFPQRDSLSERVFEEESAQARRMQDDQIARVLDELGRVPEFTQIVVNDVSGPTLIAIARDAALLVVGSGSKGALSRAFLGSVGEFCIRHSPVPVVVVPDRTSSAEDGSDQRPRVSSDRRA